MITDVSSGTYLPVNMSRQKNTCPPVDSKCCLKSTHSTVIRLLAALFSL